MRLCLTEMVLALESVLTPSNCSTFWLNSVLFSQCPMPSCDCVWRRWSRHWRVCCLLQIAQRFGLILCCFPSVQCHHANVFDGDGPGTGECAQTAVPQLPAAGVFTQKQKMEGPEGNCEKLLHFDAAGRIMLCAVAKFLVLWFSCLLALKVGL